MTTPASDAPRIIAVLRRSSGLRSAAYLSSMVGVLWLASRVPHNTESPLPHNVHTFAFPGVVIVTGCFASLRPDDWAAWRRLPRRQDIADLTRGATLGGCAIGSLLLFAAAQGWVRAPAWGWDAQALAPVTVLLRSGVSAGQTALLVFDEEMVFRGYGLDTLREALGLPGAFAVSIPLFALYHGPGWRRLLGLSAAGLLLALLRLHTGSLWFGAGFHFAWNVMQESVFGPVDRSSSLRPLEVRGPVEWIGRPGYPEPGWLQVIWTVAMAALAGASLWWSRRSRRMQRPA